MKEIDGSIVGHQQSITTFLSSSLSSSVEYQQQSEFLTDDGTLRLIRLRNPWGNTEFKANPWFTTKLRNMLEEGPKSNGTFWMSYHDFLIRFESIEVCKAHTSDWFSQSYPCYWKDHIPACIVSKPVTVAQMLTTLPSSSSVHFICMNMTVLESTWAYLSLIQKTKRGKFTSSSERLYYYKSLGLIIVDRTNGKNDIVAAKYSGCCRDSEAIEIQVNGGNYFIIIVNFDGISNANNNEYDFVLRCYSSRSVIIEKSFNSPADDSTLVNVAFSSSIRMSNPTWLRKESLLTSTIPTTNTNTNSSNRDIIDLTDDSDLILPDIKTRNKTLQFNLLRGCRGFAFVSVENDDDHYLTIQLVLRTTNFRVHYDGSTKVTSNVVKDNIATTAQVQSSSSSSSSSTTTTTSKYKTKHYTETTMTLIIPPSSISVICYLIRWPLDEDGQGMSSYKRTMNVTNSVMINEVSIINIGLENDETIATKMVPYCPIFMK